MSFYLDDYLERAGILVNRSATELICECPQCSKHKLYVRESDGVNRAGQPVRAGAWTCFYCDESGGIVALVSLVAGVSKEVARRIINRQRGRIRKSLLLPEWRPEPPVPVETEEWPPEGFTPCFHPETAQWTVPEYLADRGIKWRTAKKFDLGFCNAGRYRHRLILPVKMGGEVLTWQGRAMLSGIKPRYLHPRGAPKGSALFGFDQAAGELDVVICEGPFDVLALSQRGIPAVALLGKVCSKSQALALKRAGVERVVVMLDGDEAGRKAVKGVVAMLQALFSVKCASLPDNKDAAEISDDELQIALDSTLTTDERSDSL